MPVSLENLPNECLLLIYRQSADFDDARNLSRSCRWAYHLFRRHGPSILRSIVLESDTYKYDLRLCRVIEANHGPSPPHGPNLARCLSAKAADLTDEQVSCVVRRWDRTGTLHRLYRHPVVEAEYRAPGHRCVRGYCQHHGLPSAARRDPWGPPPSAPVRATSPPRSMPSRDPTVVAQGKRRFYRALMAYWLAVEARQLASTWCAVSTEHLHSDMVRVDALWSGRHDRTLLECMDVLEVYDFVYDFLLNRLLPVLVCQSLLRFGRLRLRPPALLELLLHGPDAAGADTLLSELSFAFDKTTRLLADWRYPLRLLEEAVEAHLRRSGLFPDGHDLANVWTCYRHHWPQRIRGAWFTLALRSVDVTRDVERYAAQAACLTRHPHFVPLSPRRRDPGDPSRATDYNS